MPMQVIMPQLGESVNEGILTKWLKAVGQQVEEYEPLVEINTDKVDTEIPSPASGTLLEILIPEGTTVHAGERLAWIGLAGETAAATSLAPAPASSTSAAAVPATPEEAAAVRLPAAASAPGSIPGPPAAGRDLGFISPVVAKIAAEHGVNLSEVQGSGLGGRITKKDIQSYIEKRAAAGPAKPAAVEMPAIAPAPSPATAPGEILPLTTVRRSIADHMVMSKRTSPHVTTIMEVDMSRVVAHRQDNKEAFARHGANLTFTAYFVAAAAVGLRAYPTVNSSWSDEGILLHRAINIGMATSLGEAGLIVPVIKNADSLSLLGIARSVNDLATRARNRQLKPDEVQGGTFSITNHGISGSLFASPIINQPQCAILGVGMLQKRPVVITDADLGDMIAIRPMLYLGLTFDHRILDGATADYFLGKIVETLREWR